MVETNILINLDIMAILIFVLHFVEGTMKWMNEIFPEETILNYQVVMSRCVFPFNKVLDKVWRKGAFFQLLWSR